MMMRQEAVRAVYIVECSLVIVYLCFEGTCFFQIVPKHGTHLPYHTAQSIYDDILIHVHSVAGPNGREPRSVIK